MGPVIAPLYRNASQEGPEPKAFEAGYLPLLRSGELSSRVAAARDRLKDCDLCARYCHVDRTLDVRGAVCRTGRNAVVSSFGPHHGEEDCLRGWAGSGTIFFSWCNLRCVYCQNWEISWKGEGREVSVEELADMMLALQRQGCHNINLVSPSHVVAQILEAVAIAAERGLKLPLVYNTGGYDSPEALDLLDGVIDIYMSDMKYGDSDLARRYSRVRNYVEVNQSAVLEMHRQVGDLVIGEDGLARRGLLVRHLVLPNRIAGSEKVLRFLAEKVSSETYVNLMDQYRPCYRAEDYPEIDRTISREAFDEARTIALRYGLVRLDERSAAQWRFLSF